MMHLLVTGGSGFIGSNFIHYMMDNYSEITITNLDVLTYAGNMENLKDIEDDSRYSFVLGDICDRAVVDDVMDRYQINTVIHFAAESHVDRSITDGSIFVKTNVVGTFTMLDAAVAHGVERFVHVSTDEVYGSTLNGSFVETDHLHPSSPYSASKAGSDLLALSYWHTHKLPVIVTRCTNNYGPYQYPEKIIPLFVTNLLDGKKVPIYGTGQNIRDWLYVVDHCRAIAFLLENGQPGEIYNIGGGKELTNLEITNEILRRLEMDESMIEYVEDRKGHDFRYSLDFTKLRKMGWEPAFSFEEAMDETVRWYIKDEWWWRPLKDGIQ